MPKMEVNASREDAMVVRVTARDNYLLADATEKDGGSSKYASPKEMFMASVASCKVMTVMLYAQRKGWEVEDVQIHLEFSPQYGRDYVMYQRIEIISDLDQEKIDRLKEIAELCPVGQYMKQGITFVNQ
ncbi:OsmC family protein [Lishizhenia sp.]|uniref:OsmC family protein n=1 Tax=Lishizhenia sp. TaxID=2497594 RepID=UPI00299D0A38|nr:OsmC family protein [Lishizhenia sp.]MDX1446167.1 OsmC family protein [Lishizhenia sp.]